MEFHVTRGITPAIREQAQRICAYVIGFHRDDAIDCIAQALASAGPDLKAVAVRIMQHCNEMPECPFCGIDDGEHEPGELCAELDAALNPSPPVPP